MRVINMSKYPLREIVGRMPIVPGTGIRGDEGTQWLLLKCGHAIARKKSQAKKLTKIRCEECGSLGSVSFSVTY